jgi:hypothetical protein
VPTPGSDRPNANGIVASYAGTLTDTVTNYAIATAAPTGTPAPTPVVMTSTASVIASGAVSTNAGGDSVFSLTQNEQFPLYTDTVTTATTTSYTASGSSTNIRALSTLETDSRTGTMYQTTYGATNGLLDIIPEANGTFTNTAAATYAETDPGTGVSGTGTQMVTTSKTINADGSYSATVNEPNTSTGVNTADSEVENSNLSAVWTIASIDPLFQIQYGAPTGGNITVTLVDPNFGLNQSLTDPSWIPAGTTTPSSETDTIATGATLDPSCAPAKTYSPVNEVSQQIVIADALAGTVETRTTSSYDAAGVGTVCTVVSDTIDVYYDYSEQEGDYLIYIDSTPASGPLIVENVSETLSLQSTNAQSLATKRATAALGGAVLLPRTAVLAQVEHLVHQHALQRLTAYRRAAALKLRGGHAK